MGVLEGQDPATSLGMQTKCFARTYSLISLILVCCARTGMDAAGRQAVWSQIKAGSAGRATLICTSKRGIHCPDRKKVSPQNDLLV
jgi:hypothetical protein